MFVLILSSLLQLGLPSGIFPSPETTSILAIDNRRENFTGSISYKSLTLSTQRLVNVSGQFVTNRALIKKNSLRPPYQKPVCTSPASHTYNI
jgi:hypothetical protein